METGRRAFSLVEILIVLVVLAILMAIVIPMYTRGTKTSTGETIESPIQRAHSAECMNNLSQLRQAYQLHAFEEERPQSLADLRAVPDSMKRCPVGGQGYEFDAASGRLRCVQSGHDKY